MKNHKRYYYLQPDTLEPVFVKHTSRPALVNVPESKYWDVYRYVDGKWQTFGTRISWEKLCAFEFVGRSG